MRSMLVAIVLTALAASSVSADEKPPKAIGWKMHTINAQSEFPACAAFDVDHDGDIDIYSGGWWYEAPAWKKHKVRDVEVIRGRFDDYSNQQQDCNGDGWTDIISVNYRSETIYWIEHPGKNLGKQDWTAHVIDKPGPSETGRLHDIDGDGDLDILPNGTTYAAWYEFKPEKKDGGLLEPKWVKHELPKEAAGHGIGWDFNGAILTPRGKITPIDAEDRHGDWRWEPYEDKLGNVALMMHKDASVPILGESRIRFVPVDPAAKVRPRSIPALPMPGGPIWGRGHSTGLYMNFAGTCAIDTSWSQCHAPLWVDINDDHRRDIIAGKRYLGHEGKDAGELDPLVIYWYSFDLDAEAWERHVIHEGGPAGLDLDPDTADLDGDGDLDLIAPSRNGLYWFENPHHKPSVVVVPDRRKILEGYTNHSKLLMVVNDAGDLEPVKTPTQSRIRRWHTLWAMEDVMGPFPETKRRAPPTIELAGSATATENYTREEVRIRVEKNSWIVVRLLIPHKRDGRLPAMLCLHPTSIPHGKKIVTGEAEAKNRNYAHELAERGYVCICPDYPTMGEHPFDLKAEGNTYQSGTMKAIWDNIRCLDVLESLPYVDPDRIGVIGHSLGGHNGLFTACFDQRIKCVVTSCGFTPFHDDDGGKMEGWAQDCYMPRIREVYGNNPDKMPFDFYEVLGAIAPRPIFINAPLHDDDFDAGGVKKCVAEVQKVYDLLGKQDGIVARYPDDKHDFPEKERMEAYDWLDKQFK